MDKAEYNEFADWRKLRDAIFERVVDDYKALVKGEIQPTRNCNLIEIEKFLTSDKCKALLADCTYTTGEDILRELQAWEERYYAQREKEAAQWE